VSTTLCHETRASHHTVIIDKASEDEVYCDHHAPRIYRFESYISTPIFRADGSFFGTICALDPRPSCLKGSTIAPVMESFARLLSVQMENEEQHQRTATALLEEREIADLRDQFIAVLGHDLRNPLFAIGAGTELLQRRISDERSLGIVQHIQTSARRASQLIEDVLDFARGRLGAGIVVDLQSNADLQQSLEHVVSELKHIHPDRVISMDMDNLQGVRCDKERLGQLLSNLVSNAIIHGAPDGEVQVSGRLTEHGLTLSVHNLGPAIAENVRAQLFKPFARPSVRSPRGGLGLGLYIACQIAVAHGGRLEVSSTDEDGTLFSFHLPLAAATV
jgi:signal transduction histidine kinase